MISRKPILFALTLATLAPASRPVAGALTTERIASGLGAAVYVTHAPNDYERLFVVTQNGFIRIIKNGSLLVTPFPDTVKIPRKAGGLEMSGAVPGPPTREERSAGART